MYEQQLDYFPKSVKRKTLASVMKTLTALLNPVRIAGIIHNKDVNEDGELVAPHVHIVLQFKNPRSLENLAKLINEPQVSAFQQWRGNVNNAYSYLIHQTSGAEEKYQYDMTNVKANFDYPTLIKTITKKVNQKHSQSDNHLIKALLDKLGAGEISKDEVISNLSGSQFAKAKKQINDVYQQVQTEKAKDWLTQKKKNHTPTTVIWIYGLSETGKTVLAKKYANSHSDNYFITGSSRDSFQNYDGEHTVILDELRPTTFPYDDLLKMLDPFGESPKAPSRFFDKSLMVDLFIITSPYSPKQFYNELFKNKNAIDSFKQLERRITFVQCLTTDYFEMQEYDDFKNCYSPVTGTRKPNSFIAQLKQQKASHSLSAYKKFSRTIL